MRKTIMTLMTAAVLLSLMLLPAAHSEENVDAAHLTKRPLAAAPQG